jgi:hypothetical protein
MLTPAGVWLGIIAIVALSDDSIVAPIRPNMLFPETSRGSEVLELGSTGVDRHSGWACRTSGKDDAVSQPRLW